MVERKSPESQVSLAEIKSALNYSQAFSDFVGKALKERYPLTQDSDHDVSGNGPDVFLPKITWDGFEVGSGNSLKKSFLSWCRDRPPIIIVPARGVPSEEIEPIYLNYFSYRPDSLSVSYGKSNPLRSRYETGFGSIGSGSFSLTFGQRVSSEQELVSFFGRHGIRLGSAEQGLAVVLKRRDWLRVEEIVLPLPAGWDILIGPTGLNDRLKRLQVTLSEFQKKEKPRKEEASAVLRSIQVGFLPKIEGSSPGEDLIKLLSQAQFERFMNLAISRFSSYPRNFFSPSAGMRGGVGELTTADGKKLPVNIEYSPGKAVSQKLRLNVSGLKIDGDRLEVMEKGNVSPCRMVVELTYEEGRLRVDSRIEKFGYQWERCGKANEMVIGDYLCRLLAGIKPAAEINMPLDEKRKRKDRHDREVISHSSFGSSIYDVSYLTGPSIPPEKKTSRYLSSDARHQAHNAEKVRRQKERGRKGAKKGK